MLDEDQLVEAEQRVAEGNPAAQPAGVCEQGVAQVGILNVNCRGGLAQHSHVALGPRERRRTRHAFQVVQQGDHAADDDVGRIPVAFVYQ